MDSTEHQYAVMTKILGKLLGEKSMHVMGNYYIWQGGERVNRGLEKKKVSGCQFFPFRHPLGSGEGLQAKASRFLRNLEGLMKGFKVQGAVSSIRKIQCSLIPLNQCLILLKAKNKEI
jgi:hypothetical protein